MRIYSHKIIVFLLFFVSAMLLSACRGGTSAGKAITVEGAWGRPSPKVAEAGAFYMVIRNTGQEADRLVGAESPACGMTELHESVMNDQGVMEMRPVTGGIEIPAGGQVELKVGGLHVMCMQKKADFQPGTRIPLTLQFEKAGDIALEIEIRPQ
jgi:copper(I)-binding protein